MMANILTSSNIECLFLNLMIFNTKLSNLDGLISFVSLKVRPPPKKKFMDLRRKKMVSERFFFVWKIPSRHSNKLDMFLLYVPNLKSDETRPLVPFVPGPLVY